MRREYYLHKRQNGIFYVEFVNPENGKKLSARSTGETDQVKAQIKAEVWKANGLPTGRLKKPRPLAEAAGIETIVKTIRKADLNADDALRIVDTLKSLGLIDISAVRNTGRGAVPFIQFLETFWNYDESEYIKDKLSHGYRFTRCYAKSCLALMKKHILPFFNDKKLNMVTIDDMENLSNKLAEAGLSTSSINQIILTAQTPLRWAFHKKILASDPTQGLTKFSIVNKERGILTMAEASALFNVGWKDERAFAASLLACTTGARRGECLALRKSDIGTDTINITYNYSPIDGLKCPKNGHKRIAPLLPEVRAALLDLLNKNPHTEVNDPFIFYSMYPDRPVVPNVILDGLTEAIKSVNEEYKKAAEKAKLEKPEIQIDYKGRNITFHSWRHFFCSKITEKIDGEKAAKVSGHLSEKIFKKYADHIEEKNIQEVGNAAKQAFENVIQFKKAG